MKSVQDIEADLARLSPEELREVAAWIEDFLEDQLEVRPDFMESIDRARTELAQGEGCIVKP
jgi:hypothetical protein